MSCTAASHQVVIKMFCLHFWDVVISHFYFTVSALPPEPQPTTYHFTITGAEALTGFILPDERCVVLEQDKEKYIIKQL